MKCSKQLYIRFTFVSWVQNQMILMIPCEIRITYDNVPILMLPIYRPM